MSFRFPPHLKDALAGALEYAEGHSEQTLEDAVESGMVQCWEGAESFVLTELRKSPTGKLTGHIFLAGGTMDELQKLYPLIELWAKSQGCTGMSLLGREGWQKTFLTKTEGFRPTMRFYQKEFV